MIKLFLAALLLSLCAQAIPLKSWEKRPKLVVVLIIDQFRSDYLIQGAEQFLPAQKNGQLGGFRFLMEKSAYFPFAQYPDFQSMTCPGHAMLLTGAPPVMTGIPINEWFNAETKKYVYCAEDDSGRLSPERLRTSTVGDELRLVNPDSKVVSLALKDRAAIMLGGHKANVALWFNSKKLNWESSSYYGDKLPDWVTEWNAKLARSHNDSWNWRDAGTEIAFTLAEEAIVREKLGKHKGADLFAMSVSNHDFVGHKFGFGSAEIKALTLEEDRKLSHFLNFLSKQMGGLQDVVFVLSADHGIAPIVEQAQAQGLQAGRIDLKDIQTRMDSWLQHKYGGKDWVIGEKYFHFYLNRDMLRKKDLALSTVLDELKKKFANEPGIAFAFTAADAERGIWPVGWLGEGLKNQYTPGLSGDLILLPKAFFMNKDENNVTHITGYSYDRQVPLLIMGGGAVAGVYPLNVNILHLAPTLSFMLGTVSPASSDGELLPIFGK